MNTLCTQSNQANLSNTSAICKSHSTSSSHQRRNHFRLIRTPLDIWSAIKKTIVRKYNQRLDREAYNYLLTLDDALLRDIGVTRQDVYWASRLPLEVDAAKKIEEIARRR